MAKNKPKTRGKFRKGVRKPLSLEDLKSLKKVLKTSKLQRMKDTSDTRPISFRKRNAEGPDMSGFKGLFKKNPKGYDDKLFKSITGNTVGTAKAFEKAGLEVPEYSGIYDSKSGGSIKKKMKKTKVKKRPALRGQGKALRGF